MIVFILQDPNSVGYSDPFSLYKNHNESELIRRKIFSYSICPDFLGLLYKVIGSP